MPGLYPAGAAMRESWIITAIVTILLMIMNLTSETSGSMHQPNYSKINNNFSSFKTLQMLDRRKLLTCHDPNPYLLVSHNVSGPLADRQTVTVTVSGVIIPSELDWIAVVSPSTSDMSTCIQDEGLYTETGDLASLPLLCHYPLKFQFLKDDPTYMKCSTQKCSKRILGVCVVRSCSGSLTFDIINIRTDIKFVFFTGGFHAPCVLAYTSPLSFANPNQPLYGHLSLVDSSGMTMRLTWVSAKSEPQTVRFAKGKSALAIVSTFNQSDMCDEIPGPASNLGWHSPGFIHSAILTGLSPSMSYSYEYGSNQAGWSSIQKMKTPPASGSSELNFIAFGDMGKAPRDHSNGHYIQPGSLNVSSAILREVASGKVDLILHIGDISYATGFLAEWDQFLDIITPIASSIPYMTAIGNHERDFPKSGSYYSSTDSGGECGVPYETYFQMPTQGKDKPWYSFESGPVHFTVMSTEHNWTVGSEQYNWIQTDLASVDRKRTPWLVFSGHRPQYASLSENLIINTLLPAVDPSFSAEVEPLLLEGQVDLALWGHVHNYERTCAVYQGRCFLLPFRAEDNGADIYKSNSYRAPVHVIVGMGGFELDKFAESHQNWSLSRICNYGYAKINATPYQLQFQLITTDDGNIKDSFVILKQ